MVGDVERENGIEDAAGHVFKDYESRIMSADDDFNDDITNENRNTNKLISTSSS